MFSNTVKTEWLNDGRNQMLLEDVSFFDSEGKQWTAKAGLISDGASVPRWAWRVIGGPFSGKYRRPAIIHDQYYDYRNAARYPEMKGVIPEKREHVDQMFYEAMLVDGVAKWKAKIMLRAVRIGGPRF